MSYDPQHQMRLNGPLTPELRARIQAIRSKRRLSLALMGEHLGFSGPFLSSLLRDEAPGSIRSVHLPRVIQALEQLEARPTLRRSAETIRDVHDQASAGNSVPHAPRGDDRPYDSQEDSKLTDLIRAAHARGFE